MTSRRIALLKRDLRSVFATADALCDLHSASPSERAEYLEQQRLRCNQRMTYAPSAFANIRAMARDRRAYLSREVALADRGDSVAI